jgi:hypothetical protein
MYIHDDNLSSRRGHNATFRVYVRRGLVVVVIYVVHGVDYQDSVSGTKSYLSIPISRSPLGAQPPSYLIGTVNISLDNETN